MPIIRNNANFRSVDEISVQPGTPFDALAGIQEYERKFRVVVKRKDVGPLMCCKAPTMPLAFAPYFGAHPDEFDFRARAIRFRCEPEYQDDWQNKVVTVQYSTRIPEGGIPQYAGANGMPIGADERNSPQNRPELQPPEVDWDFTEENETPQCDRNGKIYANSCTQPFRNPPSFPIGFPVLVFTRNEIAFNIDTAQSYSYALNGDKFLGRRKRHAMMMPPKAKQMFDGPYVYWRVTYRVKLWKIVPRRGLGDLGWSVIRGWQPRLLDQGLCELITMPDSVPLIGGKKIPCPIMRNDSPISQDVLLDGTGKVAIPDAKGKITPFWIDFTQYPELPFKKVFDRGLGGRL